jgi:hypothetical protein
LALAQLSRGSDVSYGGRLITIEQGGVLRKVCRVFFGRDGSYYVTAPYHRLKRAVLLKATVNYARAEMSIPFEEAVDIASLDDDEDALKLSHHPDGFVQFSGKGVLSGIDAAGVIRGVGVMSWPLTSPVRGPAFGMVVAGLDGHPVASETQTDLLIFRERDLWSPRAWGLVTVEGHYFPPLWRRFVKTTAAGEPVIDVLHPAKAILRLRVIFAPDDCALPGFLGIEAYAQPDGDGPGPRFSLAGPTERLRRNAAGETLGDGIFAMYPRAEIPVRRSATYRLAEVPGSEAD